MILLQGKGVSKGIAEGPLYFLQKPDTTIVKETGKDVEAEKARIAEAKEKSAAQLMELAEKCRAEAGDDAAFEASTTASSPSSATPNTRSAPPATPSPPCSPPWTTLT